MRGVLYVLACILQPICLPVPEMGTILWGTTFLNHSQAFLGGVLGTCIGILIMYRISWRFMDRIQRKESVRRKVMQFQQYIQEYRFLVIGMLFIIPVMPDEIICIGAAVTGVRLIQLLPVALLSKSIGIGMVVWAEEIGSAISLNQYEIMAVEIILLFLAARLFQKLHPYEEKRVG